MSPEYSDHGTSKRVFEESIIDNFQDFLNTLEDESICGNAEAIIWKDGNPSEQVSDVGEELGENSQFQMANLTPAGVLGWLTGQRHISLNGNTMKISVQFDHDCLARNPHHTICFPTVEACGRVVTLPVAHMRESKQFRASSCLHFAMVVLSQLLKLSQSMTCYKSNTRQLYYTIISHYIFDMYCVMY